MNRLRRLCRSIERESTRWTPSVGVLALLCTAAVLFAAKSSAPRAGLLTAASGVVAATMLVVHGHKLLSAVGRVVRTTLCASAACILLATQAPLTTDCVLVFACAFGWDVWWVSLRGEERSVGVAISTVAFLGALVAPSVSLPVEFDPATWAIALACALVSIVRSVGIRARPSGASRDCWRGVISWSRWHAARWTAALVVAGASIAVCLYASPALVPGSHEPTLAWLYAVVFGLALAVLVLGDAALTAMTAIAVLVGGIATFCADILLNQGPIAPASIAEGVVIGLAVASTLHMLSTPPRKSSAGEPRAWRASLGTASVGLAWTPFMLMGGGVGLTAVAVVIGSLTVSLAQSSIVSAWLSRAMKHAPIPEEPCQVVGSKDHNRRVLSRFAHLPPAVRWWARGKLWFDPMFPELADALPTQGRVLDVGCGFGLADVWLAVWSHGLRFYGFDPDPTRVLIAKHVLGDRGTIRMGSLAESALPLSQGPFDAALCLDVIHMLEQPAPALASLALALKPRATLVVRTTIVDSGESSAHRVERWLVRLRGQRVRGFFSASEMRSMLDETGFDDIREMRSPAGRPETMFVARRRAAATTSEERQ